MGHTQMFYISISTYSCNGGNQLPAPGRIETILPSLLTTLFASFFASFTCYKKRKTNSQGFVF